MREALFAHGVRIPSLLQHIGIIAKRCLMQNGNDTFVVDALHCTHRLNLRLGRNPVRIVVSCMQMNEQCELTKHSARIAVYAQALSLMHTGVSRVRGSVPWSHGGSNRHPVGVGLGG